MNLHESLWQAKPIIPHGVKLKAQGPNQALCRILSGPHNHLSLSFLSLLFGFTFCSGLPAVAHSVDLLVFHRQHCKLKQLPFLGYISHLAH